MNEKQKEKKQKQKKPIDKVKDFLTTTGFILEMEVAEKLKKIGYGVKVNQYFFDHDTAKKREIDIIATKKINDIDLILVIECKQSQSDDWIFICSDSTPPRYYQYQKHLPSISKIKESGVLDHLLTFNEAIPLAQNFIIKNAAGKKSESKQIDSCIEKLPKALIDIADKLPDSEKTRTLLIPVGIFNGQMFSAKYQDKLVVKEVPYVQYHTILESSPYTYKYAHLGDNTISNTPIAKTSRELGKYYLVDLISKRRLGFFLRRIEGEIKKIDVNNWPLKEIKAVDSF